MRKQLILVVSICAICVAIVSNRSLNQSALASLTIETLINKAYANGESGGDGYDTVYDTVDVGDEWNDGSFMQCCPWQICTWFCTTSHYYYECYDPGTKDCPSSENYVDDCYTICWDNV